MTAPTGGSWPATEIVITVNDDDWFPEDQRWQAQRAAFFEELRAAPDTSVISDSRDGRGTADAMIVVLGSAGAFSALVALFRAWLDGRPRRKIIMKTRNGGSTFAVTLDHLSEAELVRWLHS